ncbi:MAG: hypothetical protein ACKO3F_13710 [Cyanobium sp.]
MAFALPPLHPVVRNGLRIWLAATLASSILLWAGLESVVTVGLIFAVLFVNENDLTPASSIGQVIAGALIGVLTAQVLHELSTSWVMLGLTLLISGALVRSLGMLNGLSTSLMGCWALDLMHPGKQVDWSVVLDLAFAAIVGILMAQLATWAVWPRRPLQQFPALEAGLARELAQQIASVQQWLRAGGPRRRRCAPGPCSRGSSRCSNGWGSPRARGVTAPPPAWCAVGPRPAASGTSCCASGWCSSVCCCNCPRPYRRRRRRAAATACCSTTWTS